MSAPRLSERVECHRSSWALKSPRISVVVVEFRRLEMSGLYEVGQEDMGGM